MSHYIVARIDISDREEYSQYEAGFTEILLKYSGQLLSVDEDARLLEGEWPATRTVLIEFPSEEKAMDWYSSDEYQQLAKYRFASSEGNIVLIKGLG